MKDNFLEIVKKSTDEELEIISKDYVFYSEEEQLIALNELNSRNRLTEELLIYKKDIESSIENELGIQDIEILDRAVSKGKRFLNFLLDIIFVHIFIAILIIILNLVVYKISPESLPVIDNLKSPLLKALLKDLLLPISWLLYYSSFESLTGRTLAKYITRTKVVNEKGEKPDYKTILLRSVCRLIPFEPFSFFWSGRTGLHDEWSKTIVVKA